MTRLLTQAVRDGVRGHFKQALAKKNFAANNVEAGREFVKAYVKYIHCVEALHEQAIPGAGRLSKLHGVNGAEFALTVRDQWQRHGLGTQLFQLLVQVGRDEKRERITATMLADNHEMQHLARKVGFNVEHVPGGNEYRAEMVL